MAKINHVTEGECCFFNNEELNILISDAESRLINSGTENMTLPAVCFQLITSDYRFRLPQNIPGMKGTLKWDISCKDYIKIVDIFAPLSINELLDASIILNSQKHLGILKTRLANNIKKSCGLINSYAFNFTKEVALYYIDTIKGSSLGKDGRVTCQYVGMYVGIYDGPLVNSDGENIQEQIISYDDLVDEMDPTSSNYSYELGLFIEHYEALLIHS